MPAEQAAGSKGKGKGKAAADSKGARGRREGADAGHCRA